MTTKRALIVGGGSRAARIFRETTASKADVALTTLVRRSADPVLGELIVPTDDYFAPPPTVFDGVDTVINFAGLPQGRDGALLTAVNAAGPARLAALAKARHVRHFIHLSSFHVYGYAERITRTTAEMPTTPYGRSKLLGDQALLALQSDAFAVTILRLPALYGVGAGDNIRRLAKLLVTLSVFPVPRSPAQRSVLHLSNLAAALRSLIRDPLPGIRLAADPDLFTLELLAEAIGDATGYKPRLIRIPDVIFEPLKVALRDTYSKIYESKFAPTGECIAAGEKLPVKLRDGLTQMLSFELGKA